MATKKLQTGPRDSQTKTVTCSCLLQFGQKNPQRFLSDGPDCEYGQCCELAYEKDLKEWMETLPQCDFSER